MSHTIFLFFFASPHDGMLATLSTVHDHIYNEMKHNKKKFKTHLKDNPTTSGAHGKDSSEFEFKMDSYSDVYDHIEFRHEDESDITEC